MADNGQEPNLGRVDAENVAWISVCKRWKEARYTWSRVKVIEFILGATRNHWKVYILSCYPFVC